MVWIWYHSFWHVNKYTRDFNKDVKFVDWLIPHAKIKALSLYMMTRASHRCTKQTHQKLPRLPLSLCLSGPSHLRPSTIAFSFTLKHTFQHVLPYKRVTKSIDNGLLWGCGLAMGLTYIGRRVKKFKNPSW